MHLDRVLFLPIALSVAVLFIPCTPYGVARAEFATLEEGGIAYTIQEQTASVVRVGDLDVVASPNEGSGILETDSRLSKAELERLTGSIPMYGPHEQAEEGRWAEGSFLPFSVIYPDDRVVIPVTTDLPSSAIVQIVFRDADGNLIRACTGAMVSSDSLLTAGHCVYGHAWHSDVVVYPGRNGGLKPFGSCRGVQLFALSRWVNRNSEEEGRHHDLGGIKLDCSIGARTGWFGMRPLASGDESSITRIQGYPSDLAPKGRQWQSKDRVRHITDFNVYYQNDTYGGMSGSPVWSSEGRELFAIHTYGLHGEEPWKSNNAGTLLTPERILLIQNWIAQ